MMDAAMDDLLDDDDNCFDPEVQAFLNGETDEDPADNLD